jgi:dolichol-phosphate mannosyltransferase
MAAPRILVALATYNEIGNLPSLVNEILRVLPSADVLVIDDNSPDGTGRWCDERAAADSRVHVLHRPGKLGLGSATIDEIRWGLERSYDVFVTMDADWSHDPAHLAELVDATSTADVAIGSRYCVGGSIDGWPLSRRLISRMMNGLTRIALGLPVDDASGAFRAYRATALRRLDMASIHAVGYSYLEEMLWRLHQTGASFVEIPITFRQRRAGVSKVNLREAIGKIGTLARLACGRD